MKINITSELDKAHEAYENEKSIIIGDLNNLLIHKVFDFHIIERAIKFIKNGEI